MMASNAPEAQLTDKERLAAQAAEIEALKKRLEIDPRTSYDGIDARNVTIREQDKIIAEIQTANIRKTEIMVAVHRELSKKTRSANAPGHDHAIEGVWDMDNKELGRTPCEWCLTWKKFTALLP